MHALAPFSPPLNSSREEKRGAEAFYCTIHQWKINHRKSIKVNYAFNREQSQVEINLCNVQHEDRLTHLLNDRRCDEDFKFSPKTEEDVL